MTMIFGIAHRPDQLRGFDKQTLTRLTDFAYEVLTQYQPTQVITEALLYLG